MKYRFYIQYSGTMLEAIITPKNRFDIIIDDNYVYIYDRAIHIAKETKLLQETLVGTAQDLENLTILLERDTALETNFLNLRIFLRCPNTSNDCIYQIQQYILNLFQELLPKISQKIKSKCTFNIENIYIKSSGEYSGTLEYGDSDKTDLILLIPKQQIII
jgi:hypothetical protein